MKKELDKCILVCSNCHREIHYNLRNKKTEEIKEEILIEKERKLNVTKNGKNKGCRIVKDKVPKKENTEKHAIPNKDEVISLLSETKNFSKAGRVKNVSDNAVRKWCKKYNIPTHTSEMLLYLRNIGRLP